MSQKEETSWSFNLTVKEKTSIRESLKAELVEQAMQGANALYCETCKSKEEGRQKLTFKGIPKVMILVLSRFEGIRELKKINTFFEFPQELDFKEFMESPPSENTKYKLRGFVIHSGDYHCGHYMSCVRTNENSGTKWVLFNDDNVEDFDPSQIPNVAFGGRSEDCKEFTAVSGLSSDAIMKPNNAYVLFYERLDAESERETAEFSKSLSLIYKEEMEGKYAGLFLLEDDFGLIAKKITNPAS